MARTSAEVAHRVFALFGVANAAYERPPTTTRAWLAKHGILLHLSPWETAFVQQDAPPESSIFAASWRIEALQVLTWALRLIDELPPPSKRTDFDHVGLTDDILRAPRAFTSSATLRSDAELTAALNEMTDHHWGVRAGPAGRKLFGHPEAESSFDRGVVEQRRYAIEWLAGPDSPAWDFVRTDT